MKSIIRKNEAADSPVIATILMVAITVVLAAVLYVMVSGLITGPGGTPQAMGVGVQPSSDGSNWIVTVLSTPTGKLYSSTTLAIFHGDGSANLTATAFASLGAANGCSLSKVSPSADRKSTRLNSRHDTTSYAVCCSNQNSDGTTLLATGKLQ